MRQEAATERERALGEDVVSQRPVFLQLAQDAAIDFINFVHFGNF
jgi:hypothetical protein